MTDINHKGKNNTNLEKTIKVSLNRNTKTRKRLWHEVEVAEADADKDEWSEFRTQIRPTLEKQKTNIVIETIGEAEALLDVCDSFMREGRFNGKVSVDSNMANAYERVKNKILTELEKQDYDIITEKTGVRTKYNIE